MDHRTFYNVVHARTRSGRARMQDEFWEANVFFDAELAPAVSATPAKAAG